MAGTFLWILIVSIPIAGAMWYLGTLERRTGDGTETPAVSAPAAPAKTESPAAGGASQPASAARLTEVTAPAEKDRTPAAAVPPPPVVAVQPSIAQRATAPPEATALAPSGDSLMVGLTARRPVWVSATVDGQKAIERLLRTGEQQKIEVRREMMITAGDASALSMTLNGADARLLGKTGEVVTARVNLNNFKDYLQTR